MRKRKDVSRERVARHARRKKAMLSREPVAQVVEEGVAPLNREPRRRFPSHWKGWYRLIVDAAATCQLLGVDEAAVVATAKVCAQLQRLNFDDDPELWMRLQTQQRAWLIQLGFTPKARGAIMRDHAEVQVRPSWHEFPAQLETA